MKVRTGFVSNSSSSSFIIAISSAPKCEHCGRSDMDILDIIERSHDYDSDATSVEAIGKDNIIKYMKDNYCWSEEEKEESEDVQKVKSFDESKGKLALVTISYHDETMNNLLHNSKSIEIISEMG